ncbi:alpha/beta fold hydrolase [Alteromonas facilis]|uniref:alpha/beta fold hydrolase n=1 Tax=Alteromonas facilis TaxID=2048004 RepID=UPI0013DAE1FB|nr:alpha/beta fold hydrolase [Alteromonas facilis]
MGKFWGKCAICCLGALSVIACGGGGSTNSAPVPSSSVPTGASYWDAAVPNFAVTIDSPVIELNGPDVVFLSVDEEYEELGATAHDRQDGDVSANIEIVNLWNRFSVGDYFIRYSVSDSDGNKSLEKIRIVRVLDDTPSTMNLRPVGSTQSHLGYIESLPKDYGVDESKQYGLLIFNHGNGSNVEVSGSDPTAALQTIIRGAGPALMQQSGKWDTTLPLITLSPQMGGIGDGDELARLDAFIDYAVNTYRIDESRIYMTGWSQGGFLSLLYAADYPHRTAAAISISGGLPMNDNEAPEDICQIETVPVWAFHGEFDDVVSVDSSIRAVDYIEQNCQPTTLPRLTVFKQQNHRIHPLVYGLSAMQDAPRGVIADDNFDQYDVSIYEWLLQYTSE